MSAGTSGVCSIADADALVTLGMLDLLVTGAVAIDGYGLDHIERWTQRVPRVFVVTSRCRPWVMHVFAPPPHPARLVEARPGFRRKQGG